MLNSDAFHDKILDGWEKSETEQRVPYYVNHRLQRTQWDHPLLVKTWEELVAMDDIRYAAYRTAKKMRFLQRRLHLDRVTLSTLSGAFDRHQGRGVDGKISCLRLYNLLLDIFTLTRKDVSQKHNPEQKAELALNWILNLYDGNRSGTVRLRSAKVALVTLCNARLKEKYNYFFHLLCSTETHSLSQANLSSLLQDMIQLPEIMSESSSFGGLNVAPAVESCFNESYSHSGVAQDVFMVWMLREPQTLVWLPTLHRLTAAETVQHEAKCNVCKSYPIIGLRYKCLKCFNFDICQNCFFTGKSSKRHKLKHPTEEYCFAPSSKEGTKAFMKIIRNNLSKKHCNKFKPRYLPISGGEGDQPFKAQPGTGPSDSYGTVKPVASRDENDKPAAKVSMLKQQLPAHAHTQTTPAAASVHDKAIGSQEQRQLEGIIHHLETENRDLLDEIERLTALSRSYSSASERSEAQRRQEEQARLSAKHSVLETYNRQLEAQLGKLRRLLNQDTPPGRPSSGVSSIREPLSLISQNTPELNPYQESPPPYITQPEFRPTFPHKHLYSSSTPHYGNTPRALTIPENDLTIDNTTNGLLADLTYGSLDGTLAHTHMSLNSSGGRSRNYQAEEAELANLLKKLDLAFPGDMSQTMNYSSHDNLKAVYEAAHQIGDAMSDFVGHIGQPEDQSMFDLAEELIASRASKIHGDQEAPSRDDEDDSDFEEEDTINGPSLIYSMIDHEDHTPWQQAEEAHMYRDDSRLNNHGSPLKVHGVSHTYVDYSC